MSLGTLLQSWGELIVTRPVDYNLTLGQGSPKEEKLLFCVSGTPWSWYSSEEQGDAGREASLLSSRGKYPLALLSAHGDPGNLRRNYKWRGSRQHVGGLGPSSWLPVSFEQIDLH